MTPVSPPSPVSRVHAETETSMQQQGSQDTVTPDVAQGAATAQNTVRPQPADEAAQEEAPTLASVMKLLTQMKAKTDLIPAMKAETDLIPVMQQTLGHMNKRGARLLVATPAAALPENGFVLQNETIEKMAVPTNGKWTWTFFRKKNGLVDSYYAVSSSHCGLRNMLLSCDGSTNIGTDGNAKKVLVYVPKILFRLVDAVGFVTDENKKLSHSNKTDIIFLKLSSLPVQGDGTPYNTMEWEWIKCGNELQTELKTKPNSVAGYATSAPVCGQHCVARDDGTMKFVADSREKGNSGAIMCLVNRDSITEVVDNGGTVQEAPPRVIGVFKGIDRNDGKTTDLVESRGVIVPFPTFSEIDFIPVDRTVTTCTVTTPKKNETITLTYSKLDGQARVQGGQESHGYAVIVDISSTTIKLTKDGIATKDSMGGHADEVESVNGGYIMPYFIAATVAAAVAAGRWFSRKTK